MNLITDILKEANENIETLKAHATNSWLRNLMEAAYLPSKKMNLPEGTPPFNKNRTDDVGFNSSFWQFAKKLYVYQRTDLTPLRMETMFIKELEEASDQEAAIILAVKDQALDKLYQNLTFERLVEHGYFQATAV